MKEGHQEFRMGWVACETMGFGAINVAPIPVRRLRVTQAEHDIISFALNWFRDPVTSVVDQERLENAITTVLGPDLADVMKNAVTHLVIAKNVQEIAEKGRFVQESGVQAAQNG